MGCCPHSGICSQTVYVLCSGGPWRSRIKWSVLFFLGNYTTSQFCHPNFHPPSVANERTFDTSQFPIPATQWHTEVKIWFSVCLAKLQSYVVEWATGPRYVAGATEFITHTPEDPIGKEMCRNQVVRDSGSHQSFSVLGMAL